MTACRNVAGDERVDAGDKSSIFDVLNNEFERAKNFFPTKRGYLHILSTNQLIFVVFVLFDLK